MKARDLFRRYHQLIGELSQSAQSETDWQADLRAYIDTFEADAGELTPDSARLLREELCAQLEHDALCATQPLPQQILIAAVKWLEPEG